MTPVQDQAGFLDAVRDFSARRSRAVLLLPPEDSLAIPDEIIGRDIMLLALINPCGGRGVRLVAPNEEQTGRNATEYLLSKGHRKILHLTYARESYAMRGRAGGYTEVMRGHGLEALVRVSEEATSLMDSVVKLKPTALFCHNDWLALSAIRSLQAAGLRVPGDISVLGVDNSPTFTALCPDITTMAYPYDAIAKVVANQVAYGEGEISVPACLVVERETVRSIG
jgi:DNA-binding LacI/PurR family transcriptional regulator